MTDPTSRFGADSRPIELSDVQSCTRGLQMTRRSAKELHALIIVHAKIDMFASAVIVVAAASRLLLTGAFDYSDFTPAELRVIRRTPSEGFREMIDEWLSVVPHAEEWEEYSRQHLHAPKSEMIQRTAEGIGEPVVGIKMMTFPDNDARGVPDTSD